MPDLHGAGLDVRVDVAEGRVSFAFDGPVERAEGGTWDGPTQCMAALLEVLQAEPGEEYTGRQLVDRMRILGQPFRRTTVIEAAERLALAGSASVRNGPNRSRLFAWRAENTIEETFDDRI